MLRKHRGIICLRNEGNVNNFALFGIIGLLKRKIASEWLESCGGLQPKNGNARTGAKGRTN